MIRSKAIRTTAAVAAALIATTGLLTLAAPPAGASNVDSATLVFVPYNGQTFTIWRNGYKATPALGTTARTFEGDFSGAPGTDIFLYNPGSGADGILHVTPNGANFTFSKATVSISGTYTPVVGDYDGNGIDDVLWYAPGTAADSIWLFQANGSHTTKQLTINGTYKPTAINVDGDGDTDIVWYAPGTAADSIWRFTPGANHTTKAITINGNYQLIPGHFSVQAEGQPQRRLVFFNKNGADSMWEFTYNGDHLSTALPNVDGNFTPIVGHFTEPVLDSILYYRPGTASERFISFNSNGTADQLDAPVVNGAYDPEVGDYNGDAYDDIAWTSGGKATLWKFNGAGYTQQAITTNTVNTLPATITNFRFPA